MDAPPAPRVISASPSVFLVFLHRGPGEEEHRESYISYIARVRSILIPGRHDRDHQQRRGSVFRAASGSLSGGSFRLRMATIPLNLGVRLVLSHSRVETVRVGIGSVVRSLPMQMVQDKSITMCDVSESELTSIEGGNWLIILAIYALCKCWLCVVNH